MEGEVRRIHIIYFLSRKGRIEHPHLVRVHHYSQNGVRLCDVKRWLAELRGKDMPESFAWSYKRRYRTGYVWQDLVDEDLITPISDNEFVLKGSEIPSSNFNTNTTDINVEERVYMENENNEHEEITVDQNISSPEETQQHKQTTIYNSPKFPIIFSPVTSSLTENSINHEEEKLLETNKQNDDTDKAHVDKSDINSTSFNSARFSEKDVENEKIKDEKEKPKNKKDNSVNSRPKPKKSFNMVTKIFNCRAVETKDSVMVKFNKKKSDKEFIAIGNNSVQDEDHSNESINLPEIFKENILQGSDGILLNSWKPQRCPSARISNDGMKRSNSTRSQSKSPKPHRPINGPNCSQCGKMFKPEKMHKHMRSCSARRSFGKGSGLFASKNSFNTDHDLSSRSMDHSSSQELLSGYYLSYRDRN